MGFRVKSFVVTVGYPGALNIKSTNAYSDVMTWIEKALDMLEVWYCQTEDKDDHESSYVIRPAIQKADEALTVIRDELKRELRKAFRMPETKDAAGR